MNKKSSKIPIAIFLFVICVGVAIGLYYKPTDWVCKTFPKYTPKCTSGFVADEDDCLKTPLKYTDGLTGGAWCTPDRYRKSANWCCSRYGLDNGYKWEAVLKDG